MRELDEARGMEYIYDVNNGRSQTKMLPSYFNSHS